MQNRKVGIFGAGQAGLMVKRWLPAGCEVICFIDNNEKKQGTRLNDMPVVSLEQAIECGVDCIWIAVLNKEAAKEIELQVRHSLFMGKIIRISDFKERQDIRLASLRLLAEEIHKRNISGEMAELGVYKGELACEMNGLFPDKKLYLFDTFTGFDPKDIAAEESLMLQNDFMEYQGNVGKRDFSDTSMELVRSRLPYPKQAVFCPGYFPESLKQIEELPPLALVSLDPDLYEPVYQGLKVFYPKLVSGGAILIHDYNSIQFPGVKMAVERYCKEEKLFVVPFMDLHGSAVLLKQS